MSVRVFRQEAPESNRHADGGEALLFESEAIGDFSDDSIIVAFRNLRAPDFGELAETGRALLEDIRSAAQPRTETAYQNRFRKLKRRPRAVIHTT